jgi:hypothetical protein
MVLSSSRPREGRRRGRAVLFTFADSGARVLGSVVILF